MENMQLTNHQKHSLYEEAVQNPENEVSFIREKFEELRGRKAKVIREDFCGTAAISCLWVQQGEEYRAWGVDLDPKPVEYGKENHYGKLNHNEKERMQYCLQNVLEPFPYKTDVVFAFNFSYMIFKQRELLKNYFQKVYESLEDDGVFFMDIFGGPDSQTLMEEETEHDKFSYFWDCQQFNPISNECTFAIHFKWKGQKYKNVFQYNWRLWNVAELRDILDEVGFSKTAVYWEDDDEDGDGNGEFYVSEDEENCDSWVIYIAACK